MARHRVRKKRRQNILSEALQGQQPRDGKGLKKKVSNRVHSKAKTKPRTHTPCLTSRSYQGKKVGGIPAGKLERRALEEPPTRKISRDPFPIY